MKHVTLTLNLDDKFEDNVLHLASLVLEDPRDGSFSIPTQNQGYCQIADESMPVFPFTLEATPVLVQQFRYYDIHKDKWVRTFWERIYRFFGFRINSDSDNLYLGWQMWPWKRKKLLPIFTFKRK